MHRLRSRPDSGRELPRWARETLGAAVAVAVAVAVVAVLAASARSELLFRDGDSLVTTLIVRSIATGQPQDWALSTVLFLPETVVLAALTLIGLGVNGTLALAGVVNILALYGALRLVAGRPGRGRAPVAAALAGLAGFALIAMSETSADRDALELASLLATTTYYSATVLGVLLAVGIVRRALEREAPDTVPRGPMIVLGTVAAASVLSNPLFAAWATVPLAAVLVTVAAVRRRRVAAWLAGALVAGSLIGFLGRMPLSHLIANSGAGYADVTRWADSLVYYADLVAQRWSSPLGALSSALLLALWGWCATATVLLARRGATGAMVVAACGWLMPLAVAAGAVVLGTHAARYLQPIEFAPLLGLVLLPEMALPAWERRRGSLPRPAGRVRATVNAAAGVLVLLVSLGVGIPRISAAATAPDGDLDCVVSWVEQSGRTGAGQFWTVRLPKAHLADPRALVQVDHRLRAYAWLANRDDFAVGEVSFLVQDAQSPSFELPGGAFIDDADQISCGRYTISDFGERPLPLGPERS